MATVSAATPTRLLSLRPDSPQVAFSRCVTMGLRGLQAGSCTVMQRRQSDVRITTIGQVPTPYVLSSSRVLFGGLF